MSVPGRAWRVLPLGLPLLIYCALPTRNFYWDGVAFAIDIEKRLPIAALLHPSHLLYAVWGSYLYRLAEIAGIHTRALFVMQAANGLLAGLCVVLLYRCLRLRGVPSELSVAGALVFAFSATWWKFASDADAYVPSIFLLLCSYLLMENKRTFVLSSFAFAGAMLFHELAILFLPVALLRVKTRYTAAALVTVTAAYIIAYKAASAHATFLSWVTSHSSDSGFSFNPIMNCLLTVRGTFRLFFGGKVSDFVGDGISRGALAALVVAIAVFLIYAWRAPRHFRVSDAPFHLFVWVGVYLAFLFFWMPQNTFYRLFYLAPLILVFFTTLHYAATRLLLPALLLWNFTFAIYPQSRASFNAPLAFARSQQDGWRPGTPIVYHRFHPDLWTISYFNQQAAWIALDSADLGQLERNLNYAKKENKALWLEETAYQLVASDPQGLLWIAAHELPNKLIDFRDAKHEFRFHRMQ